MKLSEISTETVFHVTFEQKLPLIKKNGLIVGKKRNWSNVFGTKLGSTKYIYFFTDLSVAARWAHKMNYEFEKPVIILICKLESEIESDMMLGGAAIKTNENVPPKNIIGYIFPNMFLYRQITNGGTITEMPKIHTL